MRKRPLKLRLFQQFASLSFVGLGVATTFFAASVTPSLLPRHFGVLVVNTYFNQLLTVLLRIEILFTEQESMRQAIGDLLRCNR